MFRFLGALLACISCVVFVEDGWAAPVLTLRNVSVGAGLSIPASSMIVSTFDTYPVTDYAFWAGPGGGHFTYNGQVQSSGQWIYVIPSNLSALQYVGGSSPGSQTLYVVGEDITGWGTVGSLTATTTLHTTPTVNLHNVAVAQNAAIAASTLIASVSNPCNDSITQYGFWDGGTGGGHFTLGTTVKPAGQWIDVSVGSLSSLHYVGGSSPGAETLYVQVYDATTGTWLPYGSLGATTTTTLGLASDLTAAESGIDAQVLANTSNGVLLTATNPFHLTNNPTLVAQTAKDIATQFGTLQNHYTIGSSINTNGYTIGFVNVTLDLTVPGDFQYWDQCVALVQALDPNVGGTGTWKPGLAVVTSGTVNQSIQPGTPIATFTSAAYNKKHAAIYLGIGVENNEAGFFVLDQYNLPPQAGSLYPDHTTLNVNTYEPAEVRFIAVVGTQADPYASQYYTIVH